MTAARTVFDISLIFSQRFSGALDSFPTIASASDALRAGRTTSVALVEACLDAIRQWQPITNAFTLVTEEKALATAIAMDAERRRGVDRGPLHGVPMSIKDLIDVAGEPNTAASRVLDSRPAEHDAPVVTRLREAGVVFVGRTNLHEFALGTTSEDSAFGPVRHPRDASRSAGGSSGGSAVSVATGMSVASLGTDTGGSIRIPAAACGIVGLKPTTGEVTTEGVIPLSMSLDHVGPLARTVQDAATLFAVLTGARPADIERRGAGTIRLIQLNGYFDRLAPEVRDAFGAAVQRLADAGVKIGTGTVTGTDTITTTYVNVVLPEAAAWHGAYLDTRANGYTPTVRTRLLSGRSIAAVDYIAAQMDRSALRHAVDAALGDADALVLPALPIVAPARGADEIEIDPVRHERIPVRAAMLRHTQLFNMTGHPAISIPIPVDGWPVGLQLVGHRDRTTALLSVAAACERALGVRS